MDKIDQAVKKAKNIFDVAVKKTGDFVSVSKQKLTVTNLENKLNKSYAELGKLQYKSLKDSEITDPAVSEVVYDIKNIIGQIKILLNEIEQAEGKMVCPHCGEKAPANSSFCNKCGKPITNVAD